MTLDIKFLLFDAANTLIHKPSLWTKLEEILPTATNEFSILEVKKQHQLVSEATQFPDKTTKEFYDSFNHKLLEALGIKANPALLTTIHEACKNLAWEAFRDTEYLKNIDLPFGILSNFNDQLAALIQSKFELDFNPIISSAAIGKQKPSPAFYAKAIDLLPFPAENILFIGDSIRLDLIPGKEAGMQDLLIDRLNNYETYANRITNFDQLNDFLNK